MKKPANREDQTMGNSRQPNRKPKSFSVIHGEPITREEIVEASKRHETVVANDPQNAEAWRDLGLCYSALDQSEKAVHAFNRAVSLRPNFANAWDMLGMQFWENDQIALAAAAFEKAVEAEPCYKHSWATLAQMYALLHRADDAWDTWCKLREVDAKYAHQIEWLIREFLEY